MYVLFLFVFLLDLYLGKEQLGFTLILMQMVTWARIELAVLRFYMPTETVLPAPLWSWICARAFT